MSRTGSTTRDRARQTPGGPTGAPPAPPRPARRRPPLRRRTRRSLQVLAGLLVACAAAWLLGASPLFGVRDVQVDGTDAATAALVRDTAAVRTGTPLLRVDVDAVQRRVAGLEQVASVQVARGWPHSVVVTVVPRRVVAVVVRDGSPSYVDPDGVFFTPAGTPPAAVLLSVPSPGPEDLATRAAVAALAALPADVLHRVAAARASTGQDVTLQLAAGPAVLWGSADDAGRKAQVLAALLAQVAAGTLQPAGTIDVSAPDAVVLR